MAAPHMHAPLYVHTTPSFWIALVPNGLRAPYTHFPAKMTSDTRKPSRSVTEAPRHPESDIRVSASDPIANH